tara:strand:+ start:849 stop:2618 length:1770 start_codon:yes stop_codon:yes gene_type:complete
VKRFILCLLFGQIFIARAYAYQEQDLESLIDTFEYEYELTQSDKEIIEQLWQKYTSGKRLTIYEDNAVYKYEQWMNRDVEFSRSPVNKDWVAYTRFGIRGWQFVAEHQVKNGIVYELYDVPNRQSTPFFQWAPKTLKIVWQTDQSAKSNLGLYDQSKEKSQLIVKSPYRELAPHFSPLEQFVIFLSNRDRESRKDQSFALYAINIKNLSEVLKLTTQKPFKIPIGREPTIEFSDNENFQIQLNDNSHLKYKLSSLVYEAREKLKQTRKLKIEKILQLEERNKSKIKQKNYELTLDNFKYKGSDLRLVKELETVILKDYPANSKDSKTIMSQNYKEFKSIPGPTILVGDKVAYFTKLNNNKAEIWLYEGFGQVPKRVSAKGESCFGMQIDERSNTFAYLLQRLNSFYLIIVDQLTRKILNQFKVANPMLTNEVELIKILSRDKIYYKDQNGNWKLPMRVSGDAQSESNENIRTNPIITFSAPYLPDINNYSRKGSRTSIPSKQSILYRKGPSLENQIESLRSSIQWISTSQELQTVMSEYNQVHSRVVQKIKSMQKNESFAQRRLKVRWIESLNGIKALLENTKLLLEVE